MHKDETYSWKIVTRLILCLKKIVSFKKQLLLHYRSYLTFPIFFAYPIVDHFYWFEEAKHDVPRTRCDSIWDLEGQQREHWKSAF